MKIVEFAFVVYPSTDLARFRAFYEGVLGLTGTHFTERDDQFWVEYEVGPHTLGIGNEPFLKASGDGPHLVLEVDDFDDTIAPPPSPNAVCYRALRDARVAGSDHCRPGW